MGGKRTHVLRTQGEGRFIEGLPQTMSRASSNGERTRHCETGVEDALDVAAIRRIVQ